jgi:hypothetical protein
MNKAKAKDKKNIWVSVLIYIESGNFFSFPFLFLFFKKLQMSKAYLDIDIGDAEKYAEEVAGIIITNTSFMFFIFTPQCLAPVHCYRST